MNPNNECSIAITLDAELTPSRPFSTTALIPTPEGGGVLGDRSTGAAGDPMTGPENCDCCAPKSLSRDAPLAPKGPFNTTALIPTPEGGGELGDRSTGAAGDPMTGLLSSDCCVPLSPEPTEPAVDMAAPANEA